MRNNSVKLFQILNSDLNQEMRLKIFHFLALVAIMFQFGPVVWEKM